SLVEKSLVRKLPAERYQVLSVLQRYAQEKEAPARHIRQGLCRYYAEWMKTQAIAMQAEGQRQALHEVGKEIDNLRAVWRWAVEARAQEDLEALSMGLYHFYAISGWHTQGDVLFREAINTIQRHRPPTHELDTTRRRVLARMLAYRAAFEIKIGRLDEAEARLKKSLQLSRSIAHAGLIAFALDKLGRLADARGQYQQATQYYTDALRFFEKAGDEAGIAMVRNHIGYAHYRMADYPAAQEHFTSALQRYQRLQNEWGIATCLNNLGNIAFMQAEYFTARQHYLTSRSLRKAIGDLHGYATTSTNLGLLERLQGHLAEARGFLEEAGQTYALIGDQRGRARTWMTLGEVAAQEKDYTTARQLLEQSLTALERLGDENNAAFARAELALTDLKQNLVEKAHQRLNASLLFFRQCENRYGAGVCYARLARVYLQKGQLEQARHALRQVLDIVEDTRVGTLLHEAIIGVALWLNACAQPRNALGLLQSWRQYTDLPMDVDNMLAETWREIRRGYAQDSDETLPALHFSRSPNEQITMLRKLLQQ
ncbi:MAG: tetratricopeptide repeat protein, partial [Anaerolineae bacterium]